MSSRPELRLDWCSHEAAKYAVENWHYSRSYPIGKAVNVGVWEGGQFVGVVHFRNGANNNMASPYGLTQWECIELARVAMRKHQWPVSRVLSLSIRFLRQRCPGLRLIVSYADTTQGHHGGIYQANGWTYAGKTDGDTEYFVDGRWRKARNFRSSDFSKYNGMDYRQLPSRKTPGKHRYLMPLDDEMRRKIEPLRKPYPKRAGSAGSGTPPIQGGRGGATPTPALSPDP